MTSILRHAQKKRKWRTTRWLEDMEWINPSSPLLTLVGSPYRPYVMCFGLNQGRRCLTKATSRISHTLSGFCAPCEQGLEPKIPSSSKVGGAEQGFKKVLSFLLYSLLSDNLHGFCTSFLTRIKRGKKDRKKRHPSRLRLGPHSPLFGLINRVPHPPLSSVSRLLPPSSSLSL